MKIADSTLKNNFLISTLGNSEHKNTLIFVCHQSEYGSMGIILNQEYNTDLATMFEHLQIKMLSSLAKQSVFYGGDVQNARGFILHPHNELDNWLSSYQVSEELSLTSSNDVLEAIAAGTGPAKSFVALGYINWGPAELENQLMDNLWLNCPVNLDIIFSVAPHKKMQAAAQLIGIKLEALTLYSGKT